MMQILFIQEVGQVSSELMDILDIVPLTVRKSISYLGGLLIAVILYQRQLPPVNGKYFTTSPHMIPFFESKVLQHSERANCDPNFPKISNYCKSLANTLPRKPQIN